ncbi:MAG: HEAT repeat domain-containing protein, partial [Planctomycetes bacterium]|nr:HEAT repeat domain-containing protein [Planctomycetota bacterium]
MLRYLPLLALGLLLPQDEAQIRTWIKQLDDAGIEVREQALRELIKAGATAEPLLREAQQSESPEVRMRAAEALGAIALARKAKEVYREPAPLTLSHENAPISAILEDLAARSGLRIDASAVKLEGETASLKLESGTAMQALDLLCAGRSNLSW